MWRPAILYPGVQNPLSPRCFANSPPGGLTSPFSGWFQPLLSPPRPKDYIPGVSLSPNDSEKGPKGVSRTPREGLWASPCAFFPSGVGPHPKGGVKRSGPFHPPRWPDTCCIYPGETFKRPQETPLTPGDEFCPGQNAPDSLRNGFPKRGQRWFPSRPLKEPAFCRTQTLPGGSAP